MSKFFISLTCFLLTSQVTSSASSPEQVCGYAVLGENRVPLSTCIALSPEMILGGFLDKRSGSLMLECVADDGAEGNSIRVLQFTDPNCELFEEMHHLYSSSEQPIIGCNVGNADCAIRVRREADFENCENSEFSDNFEESADADNDGLDGSDQGHNPANNAEEMVFVSSVCHTSSLSEISYTLQCSAGGNRLLARFWNSATCGGQLGDEGIEGRTAGDEGSLSATDFFGNVYDDEPDEVHELVNGLCAFGHRYFIECPDLNASGLYVADGMVDEEESAAGAGGKVLSVSYVVSMVICMMFVLCMLA